MPIISKEIQEKIEKIKPWRLGAGIFKDGTPDEILALDEEVMNWFSEVMDGVQ